MGGLAPSTFSTSMIMTNACPAVGHGGDQPAHLLDTIGGGVFTSSQLRRRSFHRIDQKPCTCLLYSGDHENLWVCRYTEWQNFCRFTTGTIVPRRLTMPSTASGVRRTRDVGTCITSRNRTR